MALTGLTNFCFSLRDRTFINEIDTEAFSGVYLVTLEPVDYTRQPQRARHLRGLDLLELASLSF